MIRMTRWSVSIQSSLTPPYGTLLRFIGNDETAHVGALLELGLHSILRPIADSVEFSPQVGALTPDFIVRFGDTEIVMDVTTLAPEPASNDSNAVQRVLGQLEQIDLMGYFVNVYIDRLGTRDTRTTLLRRCFNQWIEELDREGIHRAERVCVNGGAMMDHRGGEKLYHLAPLCSINVRANC